MAQSANEPASTAPRRAGPSKISAYASAIAVVFSGYSLFETSLRQPDLTVFVPPVIQYSSPYQNSNFEVLAIPVTILNEGARTGTILSMDLTVQDAAKTKTKRFYSADLGNWTMEKARGFGLKPFSPIALAGKASQTEVILFYPRREETVQQLVNEVGSYRFTLQLNTARAEDFWLLDRLWQHPPKPVSFEMTLPVLDHRAFNTGTLPMYQKDFQTTVGDK